MKKILIVLIVLLLLTSCGNNTADLPVEIDVNGTYDVRGLSAGQSIYLLVEKDDVVSFPDCSVSENYSVSETTQIKGMRSPEMQSSNLVTTNLGNKLVVPHSDPQNNSASGEQLGASSEKTMIKVTHIKTDYDLVITSEEINQIGKTAGAKTNKDGYYQDLPIEENYHITASRLSKLSNTREVAIYQQLINMGGDKYDYGFIRENQISLSSNDKDIYGVVDLGDNPGEIGLFNCAKADTRDDSELRLYIECPKELTFEDQEILEENSFSGKSFVFKIKKSSTAEGKYYVIEITKTEETLSDQYEIISGWGLGDSRYIGQSDNGKRRKQMLTPIKNTNEKLVLFVGEIEEDFIFNLVMKETKTKYGSIRLREMNSDDCSSFAVLTNAAPERIAANAGSLPVAIGDSVKLTLSPSNGVIGFIIYNASNNNLTIDGEYKALGSYNPQLRLDKRGTNDYSCNGGTRRVRSTFNSEECLGFPHEGVRSNSIIVYYFTYDEASETVPVDITLSFGKTYSR